MNRSDFENILTSMYNNNWEIQDDCLIIHYPELIITNSQNKQHPIFDLFVKIKLDLRNINNIKFRSSDIYGIRTSFSPAEINSRYCHSHLYSLCIDEFTLFNCFCLGTGPITMSLIELTNLITTDSLYFFFYQLNEFIKWESIEGVPYKYIQNIKISTYSNSELSIPIDALNEIFKNTNFNFNINATDLTVIENTTLINSLKQVLYNKYELSNSIFTHIINGVECNIADDISNVIAMIQNEVAAVTQCFTFNGQDFNLKLINDPAFQSSDLPICLSNFSIKKNILKQLISHFNLTLTNYYIKTYEPTPYTKPRITNISKFII